MSKASEIKLSNENIPFVMQLIGGFLRTSPYFPCKSRIANVLREQTRDRNFSTIIRLQCGKRICLNLDDYISYDLFTKGVYGMESNLEPIIKNLLKEGMTFFDIGAHMGYYTLQAAAHVGDEGQVHAFEPVSSTFEHLKKNISLNGFTHVFANRYIVHEQNGRKEIFIGDIKNTGSSTVVKKLDSVDQKVEKVDCIAVDQYVSQKGLLQVNLAKIDVEGNELSVLKGMRKLLQEQKDLSLIIEIHDSLLLSQGIKPVEIYNLLKEYGFRAKQITSNKSIVLFSKN